MITTASETITRLTLISTQSEFGHGTFCTLNYWLLSIHLANDAGIAELEEQIIPLVSDAAFFQLLTFALESVSEGLKNAQHDFATDLHALSYEISLTAQPVSATMASRKCAYSPKDPANLVIKPFKPSSNSDLYYWREVFQLYVDSEIFESVREKDRGARTMEDVETRLQAFAERVTHRGLEHRLRLPGRLVNYLWN